MDIHPLSRTSGWTFLGVCYPYPIAFRCHVGFEPIAARLAALSKPPPCRTPSSPSVPPSSPFATSCQVGDPRDVSQALPHRLGAAAVTPVRFEPQGSNTWGSTMYVVTPVGIKLRGIHQYWIPNSGIHCVMPIGFERTLPHSG